MLAEMTDAYHRCQPRPDCVWRVQRRTELVPVLLKGYSRLLERLTLF